MIQSLSGDNTGKLRCGYCNNRDIHGFVFDYRHGSMICTACGCEVNQFLMTMSSYNDMQRSSEFKSVTEKQPLKNDATPAACVIETTHLPEDILHPFEYLLQYFHLTSCSNILKDANVFYNIYLVHIHRRIICSKNIIASALFSLSCKKSGFKFPFKEITLLFVSSGNLQEQHTFTAKISSLFHQIEQKATQNDTCNIDMSILIASFTKFDLTFVQEKKIKAIYAKLYTEEVIDGSNPLTMSAISLYLGMKYDDFAKDKILLTEISSKISLSITTIRKAYKIYVKNAI